MVRYLRFLGLLEGTSLVLLLGVAMPLKHFFGLPKPVSFVGMAHGLLYLMFSFSLISIGNANKWPRKKILEGLGCAILPMGTFFFDRYLAEQIRKEALAQSNR